MIKLVEILKGVSSTPYSAFFYSPLKNGDEESFYFSKPHEINLIEDIRNPQSFLSHLDEINQNKKFAYTILPYELGLLFEKRLHKLISKENERSIKEHSRIVTFDKRFIKRIKTAEIDFRGMGEQKVSSDHAVEQVSEFHLNETKKSFTNKITYVKNKIAEGDTYQVNLTANATFKFNGKVEKLFYDLLLKQSAKYSAFINLPDKNILSFSPELFFKLEGNTVTAKPMKGTAGRGKNILEDSQKKEELFLSEKNRAENLMIVDLLRNDMGKISRQNSVVVKKLFEIEKYESLFQMISIIKSRLKKETKLSDLIKNLFPCGSITGAPKIRTMEIIHQLEKKPRGIYTGSIGLMLPEKSVFNVAIRTVELSNKGSNGNIGLGAGITWGSNENEEYNEVLGKGVFLTQPANEFEIFTSFLFEKGKPFLLKQHIQRLKKSSEYFLFYYDEENVVKELKRSLNSLSGKKKYKIKVSLNKFGKTTITKTELKKETYISEGKKVRITISDKKIDTSNPFKYFKTTERGLYDSEYQKYLKEGFGEVLFLNESNNLAEGAITNIFIFHNGRWKTPPISSGILNGIYRNYFIKRHQAMEQNISINDLKHCTKVVLTNSVRKRINVHEVVLNGKTIFEND